VSKILFYNFEDLGNCVLRSTVEDVEDCFKKISSTSVRTQTTSGSHCWDQVLKLLLRCGIGPKKIELHEGMEKNMIF
jgi:hypothetical protein